MDTTLTKKQTDFLQLAKDLNGKHLKIATYSNFPLSWADKDGNGTLRGFGVAFAIVDILQEKFNFTYEVVLPHRNYEMGGADPSFSLIGLVNSSQADMAAAFLPKFNRFRSLVLYSTDIDEGVWKMMMKRPTASAAGSGLTAPFNDLVWYLTLAAVLCYGPCITFLTRLRSKLLRDEDHLPLSPSFWFVYSAFTKQGTNLAPDANTTRILFATWWMFIILLSAFYTANLTAFLTLSKFTLDIETPEDLYKKNYRWVTADGGAVQYQVKNVSSIISIVQAGIIDYLTHKDLPSTKICPLDLQSKDRQLRNSDLIMTYLIMITGLCAAAAVFIGEVLIKRYIQSKFHQEDGAKSKQKRSKRSSRRIRFDESRPPPYDSLFGNSRYNITENSKRKMDHEKERQKLQATKDKEHPLELKVYERDNES